MALASRSVFPLGTKSGQACDGLYILVKCFKGSHDGMNIHVYDQYNTILLVMYELAFFGPL